jgi:hypothetical protein
VLKFITAENKIWKALRERTAKENGVGAGDRRVLVIAFNSKPKIRLSPQRGKGDNPFI